MIIFERAMRGVSRPALARFALRAQKLAGVAGAVDILVAGDRRLKDLNRRFRKKDSPTDVLSFPRATGGDIAISAEIARRNAGHYGHSTAAELKVLILHGMLHLAGHDHARDGGRMAGIEARLRTRLKLPCSLIGRALAPKTAATKSSSAKTAGAKTSGTQPSGTQTKTRSRRRRSP